MRRSILLTTGMHSDIELCLDNSSHNVSGPESFIKTVIGWLFGENNFDQNTFCSGVSFEFFL